MRYGVILLILLAFFFGLAVFLAQQKVILEERFDGTKAFRMEVVGGQILQVEIGLDEPSEEHPISVSVWFYSPDIKQELEYIPNIIHGVHFDVSIPYDGVCRLIVHAPVRLKPYIRVRVTVISSAASFNSFRYSATKRV